MFFMSSNSNADSMTTQNRPWLLSKGAAERESKRFNLYDYIDNKNRNQMMDMWLSINTPSPFEFSLSVSYSQYDKNQNTTKSSYQTYESQFSAYAKFVGLSVEHINNFRENYSDNTGIFNLRLFGQTLQGSQLILHYGLKTRTSHSDLYRLNQQFIAGTIELYLMKYFGIHGHTRKYSTTSEPYYGDTNTIENSFGVFIDYSALRIMGRYFLEKQNSNLNNTSQNIDRDGTKISLTLFF